MFTHSHQLMHQLVHDRHTRMHTASGRSRLRRVAPAPPSVPESNVQRLPTSE
jgi:hypothetical protein